MLISRPEISPACQLEHLLLETKKGSWKEPQRREVRDYCCRPNIKWLKYKGGSFPTKIKMINFKPIARACAGNFRGERDCIGRLLSKSLKEITQNKAGVCRLGHASLIHALCANQGVPGLDEDGDDFLDPIKALIGAWLYKWKVGPVLSDPESTDDDEGNDEAEIDGFTSGAPMGDEVLDLEEVNYYDKESEKWKQAMEYRQMVAPSAFYPCYPTEAACVAGQERRMRQYQARQVSNLRTYRCIRFSANDGCMDFVHNSRAAEAQPSHDPTMNQDHPTYLSLPYYYFMLLFGCCLPACCV
ncbi:hypothetical protein L195_g013459 [Trifolium pratense]|uniref:Uncharacterized protein n=1 Tax=Trifolium pratense TaxID=57577 RepID=A0A2K3PN93_TRIPR|nr:hypothetical protein L195_g013459 [Trifolium pratense]